MAQYNQNQNNYEQEGYSGGYDGNYDNLGPQNGEGEGGYDDESIFEAGAGYSGDAANYGPESSEFGGDAVRYGGGQIGYGGEGGEQSTYDGYEPGASYNPSSYEQYGQGFAFRSDRER